MKKLSLNVEELAVEQFATEDARKGTAEAFESSKWWSGCNIGTCYC
ncbi:MAG TPA: hypothetical protein VGC13_15335 [Longimicrobium sp.]|jgi:hypothetical protein